MSGTAAMILGRYMTRSAEQVPKRLAVAHGEWRATYAEEERRVNALAAALIRSCWRVPSRKRCIAIASGLWPRRWRYQVSGSR
jgi:non-ribosomal peptide synthetase component F